MLFYSELLPTLNSSKTLLFLNVPQLAKSNGLYAPSLDGRRNDPRFGTWAIVREIWLSVNKKAPPREVGDAKVHGCLARNF